MSKYIHYFKTKREFEAAYNGNSSMTELVYDGEGRLVQFVGYDEETGRYGWYSGYYFQTDEEFPDWAAGGFLMYYNYSGWDSWTCNEGDFTVIAGASETGGIYDIPWFSYVEEDGSVRFNKTPGLPFTVEALGDGEITWRDAIKYSKNGEDWENMDFETVIDVKAGDQIRFYGYSFTTFFSSYYLYYPFSCTAPFNISGNILSLTNGRFEENTFKYMFRNCDTLISAENLQLPKEVKPHCYEGMFSGCSSLTTAPKLPAKKLERSCYDSMFENCSSLTTAPMP